MLRVCHELKLPVVARGAGTGLSGGALPHAKGVLLSLAKMKRILALDPVARIARVQPGVRNLAISEAAAPYGLYYAPDPSSQIACTIGGNVAENSGGVHCLKYGLTVHNVLRVRACTIEGEMVELGGEALDAPGFDLLALIIGSEGMLGVVTEVTVKLLPKPQTGRVILAAFDDVEKAGDAVGRRHRRGHHSGRPGNDGQAGHRARSSNSCTPATIWMRRRSCCANPTAPRRKSRRRDRAHERGAASSRRHRDPHLAERSRAPAILGRAQGGVPRRRAASRRTTTAWTAPSRASAWARCCASSPRWRRSTACAAPTCSTPATATCIR